MTIPQTCRACPSCKEAPVWPEGAKHDLKVCRHKNAMCRWAWPCQIMEPDSAPPDKCPLRAEEAARLDSVEAAVAAIEGPPRTQTAAPSSEDRIKALADRVAVLEYQIKRIAERLPHTAEVELLLKNEGQAALENRLATLESTVSGLSP